MKKTINTILSFFKKYKILSYLAIIIIVLSFVNSLLKLELRVQEALPLQKNQVDLNQSFGFTFNKKPKNITITTSPVFEFEQRIDKKKLTIIPKQKLEQETRYIIFIKQRGKEIFKYSFTTRGSTETEMVELDTQITLEEYPLAYELPLETEKYSVIYTDPLTLQITIKTGTKTQIEKEIIDWVKEKEVDPATHKFVFK